jgi:ribosomal protein S12 methylthiotransferase
MQKEIVREKNQSYLGKTIRVLIEGQHEETDLLLQGRHAGQAPDIDGRVLINDLNGQDVQIGDMVDVTITEILDYDLVGKVSKDSHA